MKKINQIQIDRNFNLSEFQCPCCNRVMLHSDLFKLLVKLRLALGQPIYINSGYRCKAENDRVGGTSSSYHIFGMAVDIEVRNVSIADVARHAEIIGFTGIGTYFGFCHLDVRPVKNHWNG